MNDFKIAGLKVLLLAIIIFSSLTGIAQSSFDVWANEFKNSLGTSDPELIKKFFDFEFGESEIESWKYELQRGNLNLDASKLIQLNKDAVLMYIPTKSVVPYNGENHEEYFDFIYRIYKIETQSGGKVLTKRIMDDFKPDFIKYQLDVDVDIEASLFLFDCVIALDLKSPHLIFKLAKDFEITSFELNDQKVDYQRFDYLVFASTNTTGNIKVHIRGRLKAPSTNNQFISMNDKSFFIRFGGFAAIPSPPPDNEGRNHFSKDSTHFEITYTYPKDYTLLQYGDFEESLTSDGRAKVKARINSPWYDAIAFYAQKNWNKKEITNGKTRIGFYFNDEDHKERDYIIAEVDTLLQWINNRFEKFGKFSINFVVLDNFVKGGLLNDTYSIVAQNAEIIGTGGSGYLHEICHSAPQPGVDGNYLWIKEGFTNFLAYEYLLEQKKDKDVWKNNKRTLLHWFGLFEEPLINIRSTTVPTYWSAYSKASWIYRMLESVIGKEDFQKVLLKIGKMDDIELKNNDAYMDVFEQISGKDLSVFTEQWLYRKDNPVLNVQGQVQKDRRGNLIKIDVVQKEPYYMLPLEVEIKTEKQSYRKTIQVEGKEAYFEMPVKGEEVSISYDPDSRLFAVIKDHKKTFTDELCNYTIPKDTATYVSKEGDKKIKVWFTRTEKGIGIHKKDENSESVLELTNKLSPVCYMKDGDVIFNQNIENKTISFDNEQHDIAEPIYPEEFVPFLFAMPDWHNVDELNMLFLRQNSKRTYIGYCNKEENAVNGFDLNLLLYGEQKKLTSFKGLPGSFEDIDGELYIFEQVYKQ